MKDIIKDPNGLKDLASCSKIVSDSLKVLQNEDRLLILCCLMTFGEQAVSDLGIKLGLVQPSLSQQLTVLRKTKMVTARREGKFIYYSVTNEKVIQLMNSLKSVFYDQINEEFDETLLKNHQEIIDA